MRPQITVNKQGAVSDTGLNVDLFTNLEAGCFFIRYLVKGAVCEKQAGPSEVPRVQGEFLKMLIFAKPTV